MAGEPLSDGVMAVISRLRAENDRLKAELRAVAETLAQALATPDPAERQKLLEWAAARAEDAGEGGEMGGPQG